MENLSIVILAAGKGKRMYSDLPKVLHPLAGKTLLSHVVNAASSLNPHQIIVVYGHGGDQVKQSLPDESITWVAQTEQKGTGHAVKQALPVLPPSGKTLILYGDVPLIQPHTLSQLIETAGDGVALLTDKLTEPTGYGRIIREKGEIVGIIEEKDCNEIQRGLEEINTGILLLPNHKAAEWLNQLSNHNAQGEYYLTDVIALAVQDNIPVKAVSVKHHWETAGVNNKSQLAELERIYQLNQAQMLMNAGVMLADPARFDLRGSLIHGKDVIIDVNVIIEGEVRLGNQVVIGANSILRNVVIGDGTHIAPFSHIDGAHIGQHNQIGPFARLRPGAQLADNVHIGNFVEVKNSHIQSGSKVNHLTYIGDADIGEQCNIGAGTITCNYDGAYKHRTRIADRVFVGSGTMLVAPVTLEEDATIGAGSVITKTAPAKGLSLTRTRQICIENWGRPQKKKESSSSKN